MRMKTKMITTMMLALFLTGMSMAPVMARPQGDGHVLRCEFEMQVFWTTPPHWEGTITGDITGTVYITEMEPKFPGITEHYFETWDITTNEGTITIYQKGVWSFKSFEFRSNGWVTAATGTWEFLLKSTAHVYGVTTPLTADPIIGQGTMWLCGFGSD